MTTVHGNGITSGGLASHGDFVVRARDFVVRYCVATRFEKIERASTIEQLSNGLKWWSAIRVRLGQLNENTDP